MLFIFLLTLFFIRVIQKNALKFGLIDIPNSRSSHTKYTARGAGIGIYLAISVIMPLFYYDFILSCLWSCLAVFLVFVVGVLDDHGDTAPKTKFIVITVATVFLSFDHLLINDLGVFFGIPITLGWLALPFTIFAVAGFTNALNLIDGLDGLAGVISIVILGSFFFVGYQNSDYFMMILASAYISGLLAFLFYNWHPASIFMGDSGSLTLGFVISMLAIKSLAYLPTISILFIAAIPIMDTLVVMVRRKRSGRSAFSADRCHFHHVMRDFFAKNTQKTVLFLGIMQLVYSMTGIQLNKEIDEGFLLILFVLNVFLLYIFTNAMIRRQQREC